MKLDFIEVSGFRGFRNTTRVDLPAGFAVLVGRNGAGKSTLLDAVDFALTGSINKFDVTSARGGGLDQHIWWVGPGRPEAHYVTVGFVSNTGERFSVTRSRGRGASESDLDRLARHLDKSASSHRVSFETTMQTSLIRDELISALSLDLAEQARFNVVRGAIGGMAGPDYSERSSAIVRASMSARDSQEEHVENSRAELGRALSELTEARSYAGRSSDISEAMKIIESLGYPLPTETIELVESLRALIADRKLALQNARDSYQRSRVIVEQLNVARDPAARARIDIARNALESAKRLREMAAEAMNAAARDAEAQRSSDQYAHQVAALLEHGSSLGRRDGHCPLCDSAVSEEQFRSAIEATRNRLAERGKLATEAAARLERNRINLTNATAFITSAQNEYAELVGLTEALERDLGIIQNQYSEMGIDVVASDLEAVDAALLREQQSVSRLERAILILESSAAADRLATIETRVRQLRSALEESETRLSSLNRAVETARQIDSAVKTSANQLLAEQFNIAMPLLKEFYRRLRPHIDWREIESDFGGKVRASLNFSVGDDRNPQFLFSSGQRRATGLAFLLAVHLSRPWCNWETLLLDDPVQHIDDYRALNLVEVLSAIRKRNRQVVIAVEDSALADVLCRRLRSLPDAIGRRFDLHSSIDGSAEIESATDIFPIARQVLGAA